MSEMAVSDFQRSDQDAVRALILSGLGEHWGEIDESLNPDLADITASYAGGRTIVVRLQDSIVATGTITRRDAMTAEILRMSVASGHRRMGLGRLVVDELITTARQWGVRAVVLETSARWREVIAFYASCGFALTHLADGPFGQDQWFRCEL